MAKKPKEVLNVVDASALGSASAHRRRAPTSIEGAPEWKCEYCGKVLVNETYFMRHTCKEKERSLELTGPIGQAGYIFYCDWMKFYKRKPPNIATFATSRYYSSFIELKKWK